MFVMQVDYGSRAPDRLREGLPLQTPIPGVGAREAMYLNRTFVMDLSICLPASYNPSNKDEEGKDFRYCFDFKHLNLVASVVEESGFLRAWKKWDRGHKRKMPVKKVTSYKVTPMQLKAKNKSTIIWRQFDLPEPENYCGQMDWDFDAVHVVRGEKAQNKELWPHLDSDTSPDALLTKLKEMVPPWRNLYVATNEPFYNYFDKLRSRYKVHLLDDYKELWSSTSEWYNETTQLNDGKPVEFDGYTRVAVDREVMEVLMSLQGSQMETDDPTTSYMLQAWARLCKCLGQDFLPYMSVVMPPLLQSAQLKPDVTITSADPDNDIEDSDDESMETITLGDKRIGIKTSVLEEKATACNMLCCYADELKEGFFPWIDQVAPTLVPLLKFYFHEEVRKAAVSAMPELLRSAKLAVEKGMAQGRNETYAKQLSDYIVPALVEALHKEPDTEICASMLDALNECIQVRSIVDEIKQVITASASRKRERAERAKAEDFDVEEGELIKEENEQEEEVSEILGTLVKTFKASFLPFFDELSSYLTPMWGRDKTAEERRIAICIFDDVAEQCREAAIKYYDTYLPFILEACNDESPDVRQAAVYGLGVCTEFCGPIFKPLVGEALSRLNAVIRHLNALQSENVMAYDNAVSALGKICLFHRGSIDAAQVVPAWLNCLPIKGDLIEAKVVHEQLCSMVERSDNDVLGPNHQYLPKIVAIFAEVLCGKDLATEQTASRMVNLLRQLQQTLAASTLASAWSSLQPQQQLALQSILSS
ncbi:hypothetical protein F3Y22_tig00110418pilonHSYRG00061 [Hibiscus syriacus]|uniref:DUF7075 domain-containing protein n=1 Tax=Hibiscus syriacus TaxID=106335 RepID=A0A6A3ANZ0_HIBSY|nr:hypothetical protein F3Y22_tig00110418pilonHSYRG00061 [Hibiscus syriacus]